MGAAGMALGDLYAGTVTTWTGRVADVAPDGWDAQTPCAAWSVRDLVNHVVGEDAWTVPLVRGSTIAEVGDRLDGDLLGERPLDAAVRRAGLAMATGGDRLPLGGTVQLSYGEEQLEEYVRQLAADHLVHAWDLAAATGGDTVLDPELVDEVATWFADREELYRAGGVVGPRVDAAGDPQTELLAHAGRDARWAVPA